MKLKSSMKSPGFFWLPDNPCNSSPGILTVAPTGGVTLELFEPAGTTLVEYGDPRFRLDPKTARAQPISSRIVGRIDKYGPVTLERCLLLRAPPVPTGSVNQCTIRAESAVVGLICDSPEEMTFSEFEFAVEGLDYWLDRTSIEIQSGATESAGSIQFWRPDDITISLSDSTNFKIRTPWSLPEQTWTKVTVEHLSQVQLIPEGPKGLDYFTDLTRKICNFFSFALNQTVSMSYITGTIEKVGIDNPTKRVQVFGEFPPYSAGEPKFSPFDVTFLYPELSGNIEELIINWVTCYERFEPSFNLFFSSQSDPNQTLEAKFLALTQGLEAIHRKTSDEKEIPTQEFRDLKSSLLKNCPEHRRELVNRKLSFANEISFRRRITALVEPFKYWFGHQGDFPRDVANARNYLTHFGSNLAGKAGGPPEWIILGQKLEILFRLHMLRLVGFGEPTINSKVEGSANMRRILGAPPKQPAIVA